MFQKVFSQIESLQVDIKSLKYRKESFWSIISHRYKLPKFNFDFKLDAHWKTRDSSVVSTPVVYLAGGRIDPQWYQYWMLIEISMNTCVFGWYKCHVLFKKILQSRLSYHVWYHLRSNRQFLDYTGGIVITQVPLYSNMNWMMKKGNFGNLYRWLILRKRFFSQIVPVFRK